jgi:type IV secretory pathway VirD2 relaxase
MQMNVSCILSTPNSSEAAPGKMVSGDINFDSIGFDFHAAKQRHERRFDLAPLATHVTYLRREAVTRDGEKARMFDATSDRADEKAFASRCEGDRHRFRFVVSLEDAGDMTDLKAFARDLVADMERDLGSRLDWIGVDHWNTYNPHVHLLIRGKTDDNLVISRNYISRGIRARAEELVTIELGPRSEHEVRSALEREVDADRWTRPDAVIRRQADDSGVIDLRLSAAGGERLRNPPPDDRPFARADEIIE